MSWLTRIRGRAGLVRTRFGETVVVHAAGGVTADVRALAQSLPADPDHELVVADLPLESSVEVWTAFAAALPKGSRPLRIVPGRRGDEVAPYVWQWLADRIGRGVLAPYGSVHPGAGSLFVHSEAHSGWVWFRRGEAPVWRGKRFPRPVWDSIEVGRNCTAGFRGVAEPLPAGMWLRPDVGEGVLTAGRARLTRTLPCLPDAPTIVLGAQDARDLEMADVAAFLRTLPAHIAAAARFVRFGGVALPNGATLGQVLADALDVEVRCHTGIPTGSPGALEVLTLRPDGSLGWSTFAQAFAYRPRAAAPRLCGHRAPIDGLGEVSPGIYWYAPDVVIEVVQVGLWIRLAEQVLDPAGVRTAPLDPVHALLLYEATDPAQTDRLREVAEHVMNRLDHPTRLAARLMPSTALSDNGLSGLARSRNPPVPVTPAPPAPAAQAPAEPTRPPEPDTATPADTPVDEPADTELPWLSRLMETTSMPVPVRPGEPAVERHDDQVR